MEMISTILKKYDTDKDKGHHYGAAYDKILSPFKREEKLNIIEIGTDKGESLLAWKEYFPNAKITGIDIVDKVSNKNKKINYIISDIKDYKPSENFDIVIDDGSHWLRDVIETVNKFAYKLNKNGILVIEDVQDYRVWIPVVATLLAPFLPYNKGYNFEIICCDLRSINNQYDDFLIDHASP